MKIYASFLRRAIKTSVTSGAGGRLDSHASFDTPYQLAEEL